MNKTLDLNASCSSSGIKASYTLKTGYKYRIKKPGSLSPMGGSNSILYYVDDGAGNILHSIGNETTDASGTWRSTFLDELIVLGNGSKRLCIYVTVGTVATINATIPYEEIYM